MARLRPRGAWRLRVVLCGDGHSDGLTVFGDSDKRAVYAATVAREHVHGIAHVHTVLRVHSPRCCNSGTAYGEFVILDVAVKDFGYAA